MDTSIFADPVKVGPGVWFKMHIDAIKAITDSLKKAFIIDINAVCDNFKCKKCQPNFRKFIDTHPLEDYWHIYDSKGRDIGFFQWTWEMHNQVNKFLKKYEPTLEEAYEYFANPEIGTCFNCVNNNSNHENESNYEISSSTYPRQNSNAHLEQKLTTSTSKSNQTRSQIPELRSRAIPPILTLYRESKNIKSQPFKLIQNN